MELRPHSTDSLPDNSKTLITLQWLVVIGTSYLSLFGKGQMVDDPGLIY